jgi:hypothetical protein
VGTAIELTVAILLPTAVGYALIGTVRGRRWIADRRRPLPDVPVERLGADLCRLHAQLDATENAAGLFAKNLRRNAVRAAYLDVLSDACRRVGVPPPVAAANASVPLAEIYRAEAALRTHGLDVRGAEAS